LKNPIQEHIFFTFGVSDMQKCCPLLTCRLTDRDGNPLNPYIPNSIEHTVLDAPEQMDVCENCPMTNSMQVAVEGYAAVYSGEKRISAPIPFCMIQSLCLSVPKGSHLTFQVKVFHCWAVPVWCDGSAAIERIKLLIRVETVVSSKAPATLLVPQVDSGLHVIDRVCIRTDRIYDCVRFRSECCICYNNCTLKADISQYNTISDGEKRTYLNSDELKEYGDQGILSPQEVSYYNVFVNGVLQPKVNYVLKKGELTFTTQDVPSKGQAVMILFNTIKGFGGQIMNVADWQYNAVSDGERKIYTNEDELQKYGNHGIPSSSEVSYFNLYINGVLQPTVNYKVIKGVLKLTTADAPSKGALVILESIVIRDPAGQLFRMETYAYNARSNGGKIYTDQDEIRMYGNQGITVQDESFYQNLFVNGVLQPDVNYMVKQGYLIFETEDSPTVGSPISLQFVSNSSAPHCGKTRMSDAALAQWGKEYAQIDESCCSVRPQKAGK
jgi:hypothetical protein